MRQHGLLNYPSDPEIKEMVERKEITIEELDIRALDSLFEYESAMVCAGKNDDALLLQITKLLSPTNPTDDVEQKHRDLIQNTLKSRTVSNTVRKLKKPFLTHMIYDYHSDPDMID